jgi:hypothetical protein
LRQWTQLQRLTAADATPGDNFGMHMSLDGMFNQRVVIGSVNNSNSMVRLIDFI